MINPWYAEIRRVVLWSLLLLFVGWLAGYPATIWAAGAGFYLAWHALQLYRLERWLSQGRAFDPPDASGIWGEIFYQIHRLQQRNRKRKRKLAAMLSRFQESTQAMPDATVVLNSRWEIEWSNDAATALLGLRGQDQGQRIDNLLRHPAFAEFIKGEDHGQGIDIPAPVDERLTLSMRLVSYGQDQRLLLARDVTRLRQLEQMRRDFVANVSHELRTPLTVIGGFLETMADADDDFGREWGRTLTLMRQQTARMQQLIEDLLLLSRLESGGVAIGDEPVAVPAMLAALVEDARALSGDAGHDIRLDAEPSLWLRGNGEELRSAFSNLVFNAVKYTPPGGRIDVTWRREDADAWFAVRDSGPGIAAHHLPRLTERFYRVDVARSRASGGTGLGLAIAKHVVTHHGGELLIESKLGKGSVFRCRFPPSLVAPAPEAAVPAVT